MKVIYHIPCFYFNMGSLQACFNEDFKAELIRKIHTTDTDYIQLQTVKVEHNGVFVDEELLTFYVDDSSKALRNFVELICKYHSDLCQSEYYCELGEELVTIRGDFKSDNS